jgi:hypothetical protein
MVMVTPITIRQWREEIVIITCMATAGLVITADHLDNPHKIFHP